MKKWIAAIAWIFALAPAFVLASGGAPEPPRGTTLPPDSAPSQALPELTPEEQAKLSYNDGLKRQLKADELWTEAEAQSANAKKHEKLLAQSRKEYEKALSNFEDATKQNPKMFQAWSGIGYAQRKLGNYDVALKAYDHALELEPRYSPAVEYRGEAYLGLNRLDDAKAAYTALFAGDRKRADELHAAMKRWIEARRADPAGVAPQTIEEFSKWVAQREELAGQTSALTAPKDGRW